MTAPPACVHEWRDMRSRSDPYRDDECKFCGVAKAEAMADDAPDDLIRRLKLIATGDVENYGATHGSANPTRWDDSDIERECGLAATALAARDAEIAAERKRADMLRQECENLRVALRRKDDGLSPCPFMGGYTAIRYDEPCPVCGDLGTTKHSDSKCVAAERTQGTP